MIKWIAKKPLVEKRIHVKFGFYRMRCQICLCPRCRHTLNADPNYQPNFCDECGQRLTFKGVEWDEAECLGIWERSDE